MQHPFSKQDIEQIEKQGITQEVVARQLETLRRGIPPIKLNRPATIGDGILKLDESQFPGLMKSHTEAASRGRISKFVPASGAASRMFKSLQSLLDQPDSITFNDLILKAQSRDADAEFGLRFFANLKKFAYYPDLADTLESGETDIERIILKGDLKELIGKLLLPEGLAFADVPKGLIPFHHYESGHRTPLEEQLVEAYQLTKDENGKVRVHFTVPEDQQRGVESHIAEFYKRFQDAEFHVSYSIQYPSTDTIAADMDGNPFRDSDGRLVFRPGGHGALIGNLNDFNADIVLIKNVDNVVPEDKNTDGILYQQLICGLLADLQAKLTTYLGELGGEVVSGDKLDEIETFARKVLNCCPAEESWKSASLRDKVDFLSDELNRPLRVCGMVENTGEPGGGPFWVNHEDGSQSLQIVETAQISKAEDQRKILQTSSHFNPVLLACGNKNFKGEPFDLMEFIDHDAGFISMKSKDGRDLKALELPGLWNGAMAKWNTIFVEVPISTLNPVKTVNDLLREEHQS